MLCYVPFVFRFKLSEIGSDEMLQMFLSKGKVLDMLGAIGFRGNPSKVGWK